MKKLSILCMAMAALILSSCASSKVEASDNFEGAWVVKEFIKDGAPVTGATANIEISAPVNGVYKLFGNAGINNILQSDFTIKGNKIAPVDSAAVPMTKKAGAPAAMAYEDAFINVLLSKNSIELDGDELVISNKDAKITFVSGSPAAMPIDVEE